MKNIPTFEQFINESKIWLADDITLAKRDKNMKELRDIAKNIDGQYSSESEKRFDSMTDKEINNYVNDYLKHAREEAKNSKLIAKIDKELERLHKSNSISIYAHANCPKHLEIKFVRPIFIDGSTTEMNSNLDFLKNTKLIKVYAQPEVKGFAVYYDGRVEDENGKSIDFEKIDNKLAVQLN